MINSVQYYPLFDQCVLRVLTIYFPDLEIDEGTYRKNSSKYLLVIEKITNANTKTNRETND